MNSNETLTERYAKIEAALRQATYLASSQALLQWDEEVCMPPKGSEVRAGMISALAGTVHRLLTDSPLLERLESLTNVTDLSDDQQVVVREAWHDLDRLRKLPSELVEELAHATSAAHLIWKEARERSDFSRFQPQLQKIVDLKKREAQYLGFADSPYDALLDGFEPGLTSAETSRILSEVKDELVPLIKRIQRATNPPDLAVLSGHFPVETQRMLITEVAAALGYDLEAGRIDTAPHPFETGFGPGDVRITTRFHEDDVWSALAGVIHETGHALYEQGLPDQYFGTPLAQPVSLAIHESQSRMWENLVGRSLAFWEYGYPKLQQFFPQPFAKLPLEEFHRAINTVRPSLIRVEADEVTYNLHIILRFELERDLIEGKIGVADLPTLWNRKMKEYLGVEVPNDAQGVLQDVHWSGGMIGYFPTYALGNLYAAQFWAAARKQLPDLDGSIARGDFEPLLSWLREHIHRHGRRYRAGELVERVTGEPLSGRAFATYLEDKYRRIYQLT